MAIYGHESYQLISVHPIYQLYPQCTQLLLTQHHAKVFIKSRSSPFSEVNHLLLWWSSSKAMAEDVMCQSDSGRARFNTITFMESMWNDSSYKTETIENFKWIVSIYNNTLSMEVHRGILCIRTYRNSFKWKEIKVWI